MEVAILTFEGFNELDSFIASSLLNKMKHAGWNVQITCPSDTVTSMNGLTIQAQQPLEYANEADIVLFGSGIYTRDIAKDVSILKRLNLNSTKQQIGAQCSGTLLMAKLGILSDLPACTDLTTKPWVIDAGVKILPQSFFAKGNIATAGGCMSSQYLATWSILKSAGLEETEAALGYVAPVGEREEYISQCVSTVSPYIT